MSNCDNCGNEADFHLCEKCATMFDEDLKKVTYEKVLGWIQTEANKMQLLQLNATIKQRFKELEQ